MRANLKHFDDRKNFEDELIADDLRRIDYLPSPGEIADACASIRSEWTLSEKRRRFVGDLMPDEPDDAWRPPVIDTSHFRMLSRGMDVGI